jgi:hypothetical protein
MAHGHRSSHLSFCSCAAEALAAPQPTVDRSQQSTKPISNTRRNRNVTHKAQPTSTHIDSNVRKLTGPRGARGRMLSATAGSSTHMPVATQHNTPCNWIYLGLQVASEQEHTGQTTCPTDSLQSPPHHRIRQPYGGPTILTQQHARQGCHSWRACSAAVPHRPPTVCKRKEQSINHSHTGVALSVIGWGLLDSSCAQARYELQRP